MSENNLFSLSRYKAVMAILFRLLLDDYALPKNGFSYEIDNGTLRITGDFTEDQFPILEYLHFQSVYDNTWEWLG